MVILEEKVRICSVLLVRENEQEEDGGSDGGRQYAHRVRVRAISIRQTARMGVASVFLTNREKSLL